jgi:hypothetical protein
MPTIIMIAVPRNSAKYSGRCDFTERSFPIKPGRLRNEYTGQRPTLAGPVIF